jgi:hypothetical protein
MRYFHHFIHPFSGLLSLVPANAKNIYSCRLLPTHDRLPNLFPSGSRKGPEAEGRKEGKTEEEKTLQLSLDRYESI